MTLITTVCFVTIFSLVTTLSIICILHHRCDLCSFIKKKKKKDETNVIIKYGANSKLRQSIIIENLQPKTKNEVPSASMDIQEMDVTEELLYGNLSTSRRETSSSSSTFSNSWTDHTISDIYIPHLPSVDPSPEVSPPRLTFSLLTTKIGDNSSIVNLSITMDSVSDLPTRDYGVNCDPLVQISLFRENNSTSSPLEVFRTPTLRNIRSPVYCYTTNIELKSKELEDFIVVFTVIDDDKHIGEDILGNIAITLKDAKQTVKKPERYTVTHTLQMEKPSVGHILIGITNVSTSEKISFQIMKVSNIKVDINIEDLNLYVKILQFNKGRLVKKKKTLVKHGTKNPLFNETIDFNVQASVLDQTNFVVIICDKDVHDMYDSEDEMMKDYSGVRSSRKKDVCIGKLVIGESAKGDEEKEHWSKMIQKPNKMISHCHNLK